MNAALPAAARTAAAVAARRRGTSAALERVHAAPTRLQRENAQVNVAAGARRAGVSRTFLYDNLKVSAAVAAAIIAAAKRRCQIVAARDSESEASWRERALNAEEALKSTHAEIRTQRIRLGELVGRLRDLPAEQNIDGLARLVTENAALKQRVRQLSGEIRKPDERLTAARTNLRFRDRRIADLQAQIADPQAVVPTAAAEGPLVAGHVRKGEPGVELLIAANPDPKSRLRYLLHLPLGGGLLFRTSGTWPRTKALYCYPVPVEEWPEDPDNAERVPLRSCARRGAAIDLVVDRGRENRSQILFTQARGRQAVFWQSPRTRKQARPNVRTPSARAAGITELEIVVDSHEQYAYHFSGQQVRTVTQALPRGDYGITADGRLVASVERKSLADLVASLTGGKLRYALGELAALPRAAVVVEDRYSQTFTLDRVRPALVADGLAELQIRWPSAPIVFCETRALAEEYTYRFRIGADNDSPSELAAAPTAPEPSTAEVRAWARAQDIPVPERGKLRPDIWQAWRTAHRQGHPR